MFKKILVCLDGSEDARAATVLAGDLAERFGSDIVGLNVFDLSFAVSGELGAWSVAIPQETIDLCMEGQRQVAEKALRGVCEKKGQPYRMLQEIGHPVDAIIDTANQEHADLIMLGSRGLNGIKEMFLGSVSHGVLHHAHCPVFIHRGEGAPIRRILLASDGSAGATSAAAAAFELAKKCDACITVLNVVPPSGHTPAHHPAQPESSETHVEDRERSKAIRESLQTIVMDTAVPYHLYQDAGHPGKVIVQSAQSGKYDLIVMGSRGLGGFARMMLGSVSNYVAHHAACSLLVVR